MALKMPAADAVKRIEYTVDRRHFGEVKVTIVPQRHIMFTYDIMSKALALMGETPDVCFIPIDQNDCVEVSDVEHLLRLLREQAKELDRHRW